jgi:SAM-dependent methyltransferase
MKRLLRTIYGYSTRFGIDPRAGFASLRGVPRFAADLRAFKRAHAGAGTNREWPLADLYPCFADRYEQSGSASGHYFHQDLLVARRIFARNPEQHVDVGSRIDGFVAHVASFRPIRILDIRELTSKIPNVTFGQCDLMGELPPAFDASCDSLSCLHALEHFGLGRYGDPLRPKGHETALSNMARMVKPGGWFYVSVPIGPQRIEFNAHRVFGLRHLLDLVGRAFEISALSIVDDSGELHETIALHDRSVIDASFGCRYGCAIVEAVRRGPALQAQQRVRAEGVATERCA